MTSIHVFLRDLRISPCNILVTAENKDEQEPKTEHLLVELCDCEKALAEFTVIAKELVIDHANVDVYIAVYGYQVTIKFPPEFLRLLNERGWPLELDVNE